MRGDCRSAAETEYYHVFCALVAEYEQRAGADRWHKLPPIEALTGLLLPTLNVDAGDQEPKHQRSFSKDSQGFKIRRKVTRHG